MRAPNEHNCTKYHENHLKRKNLLLTVTAPVRASRAWKRPAVTYRQQPFGTAHRHSPIQTPRVPQESETAPHSRQGMIRHTRSAPCCLQPPGGNPFLPDPHVLRAPRPPETLPPPVSAGRCTQNQPPVGENAPALKGMPPKEAAACAP